MEIVTLEGLIAVLRQVQRASDAISSIIRVDKDLRGWNEALYKLKAKLDVLSESVRSYNQDNHQGNGPSVSVLSLTKILEEMRTLYGQVHREGNEKKWRRNKALAKYENDFNKLKAQFDQQVSELKRAIIALIPEPDPEGYVTYNIDS